MISDQEKIECIKWAKNLSIKHQKYEAAASLRDKEKNLINLVQIEDHKMPYPISDNYWQLDNFNQPQLKYMQELLEEYFSFGESQLICEIIQLRRNNNIINLLG